MVLTALFTAILFLLNFTPLGLIDLPLIKATILHVPVIIGSILLGPARGAFLGGVFGLLSMWKSTVAPSLLSFAFSPFIPLPGESHGSPWALLIAFVPRILVGVFPALIVRLFERIPGRPALMKTVGCTAAGILGSATNTVLVMGLMGLCLGDSFAAVKGIGGDAVWTGILAIMSANGIPEALAAAVLVPAVTMGLTKALGAMNIRKGS